MEKTVLTEWTLPKCEEIGERIKRERRRLEKQQKRKRQKKKGRGIRIS